MEQTKEQEITGVTLAQDALKWLGVGKISATTGSYTDDAISAFNADEDCKDVIEKEIRACKVCHLGALTIAYILRKDAITVGDYAQLTREGIAELLRSHISDTMLGLMESAFEKGGYFYISSIRRERDIPEYVDSITFLTDEDRAIRTRAVMFGEQYRDPKARMVAILENYIANNGEFKP